LAQSWTAQPHGKEVDIMRLAQKTAIVTGAKSGIGLATARLFAAEGARVVLADRLDPPAEAASIAAEGHFSVPETVDVLDAAAVDRLVDRTVLRFGRLDILVNNAGIDLPKTLPDTTEEEWDSVLGVNLKGVFLCSRAAISTMRQTGGGNIVNVASELGLVGGSSIAAYCASKGGVVQLTKAMAIDHAHENIRVNCVCPGPVETPLLHSIIHGSPDQAAELADIIQRTLLKRLGKPDEIARALLFAASDESSFMTGSILVVDGGWTAQ
jgi:NAD(P)-dependent dehydrogenase (short-subunit alcohol dehydrogenase family)